jgi:hypothetical protein
MVPSSVFSVTPVFLSFDAIEMVVTMDAVVVSMLVGPFSVALASNTVVGAPAEAVALNANTDVVAPTATLIEGMVRDGQQGAGTCRDCLSAEMTDLRITENEYCHEILLVYMLIGESGTRYAKKKLSLWESLSKSWRLARQHANPSCTTIDIKQDELRPKCVDIGSRHFMGAGIRLLEPEARISLEDLFDLPDQLVAVNPEDPCEHGVFTSKAVIQVLLGHNQAPNNT